MFEVKYFYFSARRAKMFTMNEKNKLIEWNLMKYKIQNSMKMSV